MAMVDSVAENLATAERLVREAAGQRRQRRAHPRAVRRPVLLQGHAARALRPGQAARRPPHRRALPEGGGRAGGGAAAQPLRAGQPGHLQLGGGGGRRRQRARHLPQEPHPRRPGLHREVLLQPRRHRLPRLAHAPRRDRRGHLLGPVVPRDGPLDGAPRCRAAVLPDGHRQRTARSGVGLGRPLAAGDAGPRRRQPHAAGGGQPGGPRGGADDRDHVLRVVVHRRLHRGAGGHRPPGGGGGVGRNLRPGRAGSPAQRVGPVPGSPPRAVRPAADARRWPC